MKLIVLGVVGVFAVGVVALYGLLGSNAAAPLGAAVRADPAKARSLTLASIDRCIPDSQRELLARPNVRDLIADVMIETMSHMVGDRSKAEARKQTSEMILKRGEDFSSAELREFNAAYEVVFKDKSVFNCQVGEIAVGLKVLSRAEVSPALSFREWSAADPKRTRAAMVRAMESCFDVVGMAGWRNPKVQNFHVKLNLLSVMAGLDGKDKEKAKEEVQEFVQKTLETFTPQERRLSEEVLDGSWQRSMPKDCVARSLAAAANSS